MDMAAKSEPNTGFPKCETVPMRSNFKLNDGSNGTVCSGNSSNIDKKPFISQGGNANWSVDEAKKLEEGLAKYADEPIVMKYIKIASTLPDKTVRDVALRCKWKIIKQRKPEHNLGKKANNRKIKQRKPEEHNPENKANSRKDKPVESTCKQYLQSALPPSLATCACMVHHMDERQHIPYDGICGPLKHLLDQNVHAFSQTAANVVTSMRETPGIMSLMPPHPLFVNEDLISTIFPTSLLQHRIDEHYKDGYD